MSASANVAGRGIAVDLGVSRGIAMGEEVVMAVRNGVAVIGFVTRVDLGLCIVGEDVAVTLGQDAVVKVSTRVGPGACAVGAGASALGGCVGVGVTAPSVEGTVDVENCGSSSPGISNTSCATARSLDLWIAPILASAAQITPMSAISITIMIHRRLATATVLPWLTQTLLLSLPRTIASSITHQSCRQLGHRIIQAVQAERCRRASAATS